MSLLRPLLLVTLLALAGTATAGAAPASAVTVKCGLKRFSFVFWPKGNRAEALPHFDFYKLTSSYPNSALLARIDREGGGIFVPRCRRTAAPLVRSIAGAIRTRRARALRCGFPREATIHIHPISNNDEELGIHVVAGGRTFLYAKMYDHKTPVLTYNRVYCHRARLP